MKQEVFPRISVIIPVYNTVHYLHRCINSVQKQKYNNLEIVLVDDGSFDGSEKQCDIYANEDERIIVVHQKNQGLSVARNNGVFYSHGDYITFLDSDDFFLHSDDIFYLYSLLIKFEADMSVANIKYVYGNEEKTKNEKELIELEITSDEALRKLFYLNGFPSVAVAKLYKKSILEKCEFPKGLTYEDWLTTYKLIINSDRIALSNKVVYGYFQRNESIMHGGINSTKIESVCEMRKIVDNIYKVKPDLKRAAEYYFVSGLTLLLPDVVMDSKHRKANIKRLAALQKEYQKDVWLDCNGTVTRKMRSIALAVGEPAVCIVEYLRIIVLRLFGYVHREKYDISRKIG